MGALRADRRRLRRRHRTDCRAHQGSRSVRAAAEQRSRPSQHSLAAMAGELERARAATALAIAAAADYGFDSRQADYAVTVAKVAVGRAVAPVTTIAHQLHGAIGVTIEHPLWLATMRARSWADEFGTTGHHARTAWPDGARRRMTPGRGRRTPSSGVQHLADAGFDDDAVTEVVHVDVGTARRARRAPRPRCRSGSSRCRPCGGSPDFGREGCTALRR